MNQPQSFLHQPTHTPRPGPAPTPVGTETGSGFVPPAPPLPTLSISPQPKRPGYYRASLHRALVAELGLRDSQAGTIRPPAYGSPFWYLDLRPGVTQKISCYADSRPRIEGIPLPDGSAPLTLALVYRHPDYPNIYCLLPADALPAQAK